MWELNVKSTFFLIKESKALMTASGKGASVLVVSSVTG
jgi:NAD(P)-dependent dehydrogenase (short-subunit alcohol dehydrogenase family)